MFAPDCEDEYEAVTVSLFTSETQTQEKERAEKDLLARFLQFRTTLMLVGGVMLQPDPQYCNALVKAAIRINTKVCSSAQ